jgi:hypothetical protein
MSVAKRMQELKERITANVAKAKEAEVVSKAKDANMYLILGVVMVVIVSLALYFKFREK